MRVKIITDGYADGTRAVNAETGEVIDGLVGVTCRPKKPGDPDLWDVTILASQFEYTPIEHFDDEVDVKQ